MTSTRRLCQYSLRILLLLIVAGVCVACLRGKVYDHYEQLPIAGWEKNDTIIFTVPPMATAGIYSIDLGLRTTGLYPFMSLTLVFEKEVVSTDTMAATAFTAHPVVTTLQCRLTDKQGHTQGQGVNYYQHNFHVADLPLAQGDSLRINIRHDMKREILPGISDLGITLTKK